MAACRIAAVIVRENASSRFPPFIAVFHYAAAEADSAGRYFAPERCVPFRLCCLVFVHRGVVKRVNSVFCYYKRLYCFLRVQAEPVSECVSRIMVYSPYVYKVQAVIVCAAFKVSNCFHCSGKLERNSHYWMPIASFNDICIARHFIYQRKLSRFFLLVA